VLKSDANADLVTAVNQVRRGVQYFTGYLAATIAEGFGGQFNPSFSGILLLLNESNTWRELSFRLSN
jgi:hypothetical protein